MQKRLLTELGHWILLVGAVATFGGLGMLLGRLFPIIVNNAGFVALFGLALLVVGGFILEYADPWPHEQEKSSN